MKVLVLSCNTGQGHNTAGKAVQEEFLRRNIPCDLQDALAFGGSLFSKGTCGAYTKLVVHTPHLFGFGYRVCGVISNRHIKSPVYLINKLYRRRMWRFIQSGGYDTIVMPHLFPAQTVTSMRKHLPLEAGCYEVSTDYTCIPFLEELDMDALFIPHASLLPQFEKRNLKSPLVVSGIPVSKRFSERVPQEEARRALGLPSGVPIVLMMGGSMGFGDMTALLEQLLEKAPQDTHAVVMGGNNESLKSRLRKQFDPARVTVLDYTDRVNEYMDAADLLFSKPGGLTSTEAAVKNIALVHTAHIPGVETHNVAFFKEHGLSVGGHKTDELLSHALSLLQNADLRAEMCARQRQTIAPDAAATICDYIVKDYARVHGHEPEI
ncbi:MAG: glycosyl transferase [Clostridia bacterium]|nr:glycosyl transferase [Clostridia bacterium]